MWSILLKTGEIWMSLSNCFARASKETKISVINQSQSHRIYSNCLGHNVKLHDIRQQLTKEKKNDTKQDVKYFKFFNSFCCCWLGATSDSTHNLTLALCWRITSGSVRGPCKVVVFKQGFICMAKALTFVINSLASMFEDFKQLFGACTKVGQLLK